MDALQAATKRIVTYLSEDFGYASDHLAQVGEAFVLPFTAGDLYVYVYLENFGRNVRVMVNVWVDVLDDLQKSSDLTDYVATNADRFGIGHLSLEHQDSTWCLRMSHRLLANSIDRDDFSLTCAALRDTQVLVADEVHQLCEAN